MTTENYYDVLGLKPSATEQEIRKAYIQESLRYHPDRNPDPSATSKFKLVAQAYYTLSDKDRKKLYDNSNILPNIDAVNPINVFGSVFDDLLVPEVPNPVYFYQPLGTLAGAMLGFIFLNVPGCLIGGYYGNRMGKVRDMKGVSVYEAFTKLSVDKRSEILSGFAKRFLSQAITSN